MESENRWTRKDVWLGLLFLGVGALVTLYAWGAMRNEVPSVFWWPGWVIGPLLILLGVNAVVRSLRAGWGKGADEES